LIHQIPSEAYTETEDRTEGGCGLKIIVTKVPGIFSFFLRRIYGIPKK